MIFLTVTFMSLAVSIVTGFLGVLHLRSCRVCLLLLWQDHATIASFAQLLCRSAAKIWQQFAKRQISPRTEEEADEANVEVEGSEQAGDVDLQSNLWMKRFLKGKGEYYCKIYCLNCIFKE